MTEADIPHRDEREDIAQIVESLASYDEVTRHLLQPLARLLAAVSEEKEDTVMSTDPPPAEVICDLDLMDYQMRGFGAGYTLTGKKRRKAQLEDAARLLDEGTPFIFDGRRIPGAHEIARR